MLFLEVETVEIVEEEETVFMPARATPSLTMEQPAVVMPIRTNLRSNLTVRFGYDNSEEFTVLLLLLKRRLSLRKFNRTRLQSLFQPWKALLRCFQPRRFLLPRALNRS